MKTTQDIARALQQLHVPASPELDQRIQNALARAPVAPSLTPSEDAPALWTLITLIMKRKSVRYSLGTGLGLALLATLLVQHATTTAWAMEQTIEALQKYKALHIRGYSGSGSSAGPLEVWARANPSGTHSGACLARMGNITVWVDGAKTYAYEPEHQRVWVEPGITAGLNPWFGPKFLTTLARMHDYQAHKGVDAATGKPRVLVSGSLETVLGPQSFLLEFDGETKLPVSLKGWRNLKRHGAPEFVFEKIVYFEDLPDSTFRFTPPPGVTFVDKPLTIPEENLRGLSDPDDGIAVDGLTREAACRKLLEQFLNACIREDMARVHQLCPLTRAWPDGLFRDLGGEDQMSELQSIGGIEREGQSPLGPLALVPCRVRCKDDQVRELRMVVQFRGNGPEASCVVHGPHGNSIDVE